MNQQDDGWKAAFQAWWLSRPTVKRVLSPRGFAQMVWWAAWKAAQSPKEAE